MDKNQRKNKLKQIILDLHAGKDAQRLKEEFKKEFGSIKSEEIAQMEQDLINSRELTADQITHLCDLHVQIFKESIQVNIPTQLKSGHPIHTYRLENTHVSKLIRQLREKYDETTFKSLADIKTHYTRLENQLFPVLEKVGFKGPSQVMWSKHDEIREMFRNVDTIDKKKLYEAIEEMIYKEENILFPTALEKLTEKDWLQVKKGEDQIGFAWVQPGKEWEPITPADIHHPLPKTPLDSNTDTVLQNQSKIKTPSNLVSVSLNLNVGNLSLEQLDLMLRHLPIDLTFIDPNDNVLYFSDTPERIFPRSPGIIGRNVMNCHPPKSQHIVKKILTKFKSGEKDVADFWIHLGEKYVYIRYFAVRDAQGVYQGTLEVSQEISDIQKIEGDRRLLNWEENN